VGSKTALRQFLWSWDWAIGPVRRAWSVILVGIGVAWKIQRGSGPVQRVVLVH
jgi:hypothetical protein